MLGAYDLVDEVGELLGFDKVFQEAIIKERDYFVDDLKGLDSELSVDGALVNEEDSWK